MLCLLAIGLMVTQIGGCPWLAPAENGANGGNGGDGGNGGNGGNGGTQNGGNGDGGTGEYQCLTDAAGVLTVIWVRIEGQGGGILGTPTARFEYTTVPWYFATTPSDHVLAFVGSQEDYADIEETEGPYLDAGTPLLVEGAPEGDIQLIRQADNSYALNPLTLAPRTFNPGETFEWDVPGGADVNAFIKEMPVPELLSVSSPALGSVTLDRSSPLRITWDPPQIREDAHIIVAITAGAGNNFGIVEGDLVDDGSATIGAEYLSQLPSDDVFIAVFRAHYGSVALSKPAGKKVYFSSQTLGWASQ